VKGRRAEDGQLQRKIELVVEHPLTSSKSSTPSIASGKSAWPILFAIALFLFLVVHYPSSGPPFSESPKLPIFLPLSRLNHTHILIDSQQCIDDLNDTLKIMTTAISDLDMRIHFSDLNSRETTNQRLQEFSYLSDVLADQLRERNATAHSLVDSMIIANDRMSDHLARFAAASRLALRLNATASFLHVTNYLSRLPSNLGLSVQPSISTAPLTFSDLLNELENHTIQITRQLVDVQRSDENILSHLTQCSEALTHARDTLVDPSIGLHNDNKIWPRAFIAAGGRWNDEGLVEPQTITLSRIDTFLPEMRDQVRQDVGMVARGARAAEAMRLIIQQYRRKHGGAMVAGLATVMDESAREMQWENLEVKVKWGRVKARSQARRKLVGRDLEDKV
jgi:hypothetical protein